LALSTELKSLLDQVQAAVADARSGLPQDVFYFVSRLTPMINVDLLVRDRQGQTLLTWRHDAFYGPGWHIPGGIIRFKEKIEQRIKIVAESEIGCCVRFNPDPLGVREIMCRDRDIRGHFISMIYLCELDGAPDPGRRANAANPRNGQWEWHRGAPANLIAQHEIFRSFIDADLAR
jgi:colanic acid biosynthesis protein WcaH